MPTINIPLSLRLNRLSMFSDSRLNPPTSTAIQGYTAVNIGGYANSRTLNQNPSWKVQVAKKENASTAYSRTVVSLEHLQPWKHSVRTLPTGPTASYQVSDSVTCFDSCYSHSFGSSTDSSLATSAIEKLKNQLREQTSRAQALAPIAECRELHGLVRQAATFTGDFLQALHQLRKGRTVNTRRLTSEAWLGWNFGIKPMVKDISSIGKSIADYLSREDLKVRLRVKSKKDFSGSFTPIPSFAPAFGCALKAVGGYNAKLSYSYLGSYSVKLKSSNDYSALDAVGINLESVPSALWELTGFSWIADYFGNIGSYLSDVFYSPPGNLIYLVQIRRFESRATTNITPYIVPGNPNNIETLSSNNSGCTVRLFQIDRTVLATLPVTGLRVKTLDEITPHSLTRIFNLLAILGK